MKSMIVGSIGLILGLLAAAAHAQETPWRPAAPAQAVKPAPMITLWAPVADSSVQQTSYDSTSWDSSSLVRAKMVDAPTQTAQPPSSGPSLEAAPMPNPIYSMPSASPDQKWGQTAPPQAFAVPDGVVGPNGAVGPNGVVSSYGGGVPNGATMAPPGYDGQGVIVGNCGQPGCDWLGNQPFDPCGNGCDPCCNGCCAPRSCFWISGEYLLWTVKSAPTPFLVTGNSTGNPPVIGVPGTQVLYGGTNQGLDIRSGAKLTLGFALPCTDHDLGFETTFFFLGDRSNNATFSSNGNPMIGRPYVEVGPQLNGFPGNQAAEIVAAPGVPGSVTVRTTNDLWGIEENIRYPLCCGCNWKVDFLGGFRFLQLDEQLGITENINVLPSAALNGANVVVIDNFHTRNDFYGGQIGIDAEWRWGRWFIGGTGKLAMGDMHEYVAINGYTTTTPSGGTPSTQPGGLLALQGTNIGQYNRDTFAIVPELGLKVGFNFTESLRFYVGYNVVYASSVVRPGDQVNLDVNSKYLPPVGGGVGAPLPDFAFRTTDFWAQGVSFGLEWRF